MSDISENEAIEENLEVPLTKKQGATRSPTTPDPTASGIAKKPRSQAQVEAFEKVKEKRRQNLEAKKQEKILNSAKLLIEEETRKISNQAPAKTVPKKKLKHEPQHDPLEEESESEEEIIVVKKKKTPVKKVRKIIIEESSSEEEEAEEEQEYYRQPSQSRRQGQIIRLNPNDIFC